MLQEKVSFADLRTFSSFFLDYISQKDSLKSFYNHPPELSQFQHQLLEKSSFPQEHRRVLSECLKRQYAGITVSPSVSRNISALTSPITFTVTTGHQLNLFTGPLYFIYKIVTVINTCRQLKAKYPDSNFVPVYWMASEDHDFEEISYFRLSGKKYTWKTRQTGAVGRFHLRDLKSLLKEIPGQKDIFERAYSDFATLSAAVRYYINELFGSEGLIVLDADSVELKKLLIPVIQDDLFKHSADRLVSATDKRLESLGYSVQVHPRKINLFYLDESIRNRIESSGDRFNIVDTDLSFSRSEMEQLIIQSPEKFSPNVILRPLYQEIILPNLAYVGGPAEVIYWLQLKDVFTHFKIPFPVVMPRNFALIISEAVNRKMKKTGLAAIDFFEDKNFIFNNWVLKNTTHDLSVGTEIHNVQTTFDKLKARASAIDPTLFQLVGAEAKRVQNGLEKIEHKLLKAEKRRHSEKLKQIDSVKDALFPNGSLQERTDNFLDFYQQDLAFIQKLIRYFDPFDFQFNIFRYDDQGGNSESVS